MIRTVRKDGWENVITGLGTSRDKTTFGAYYSAAPLSPNELLAMFNDHDLARRVVSIRPREMLRGGFSVEVSDDAEQSEEINEFLKGRKLVQQVKHAMTFSRLLGGGLLIGGLDDGQDQSQPLREDGIRNLRYLTFIDRRFATPATWYEDPESDKFLEVESYDIQTPNGRTLSRVHETRCIRFGGAETDAVTSRSLNGWDHSVLQNVYNTLRAFEGNWQAVNVLMSDASQAVFKIKGLLASLASPNGQATMQTRMELIDMARSVARAIVLDADHGEDFHREPTSFAGMSDILDRGMMRVSAAADVPVSLLFGRSVAGLNATGEGDYRGFYDSIESERTQDLEPVLRRLITWALSAQDGPVSGDIPDFEIVFGSLWQPSASEQATVEKTYAERDAIMMTNGVWLPEEVALSRARGGYNSPVEIDQEMRETMLEREKELAEDPPEPPQVPDATNTPPVTGRAPQGVGQPPPVPGGGNENAGAGSKDPQEDAG